MLPAESRLTSPASFRQTTRSGRRSGARTLVTHLGAGATEGPLLSGPPSSPSPSPVNSPASPRVGFVVSRAVGNAVVRNRVKRRLRHAMRDRLTTLPAGSTLVVRAQPAAAAASYQELDADLGRCLERSLSPEPGSGSVAP